jgi:non-canonical poly(A) RNA polymerase PAPD5/7
LGQCRSFRYAQNGCLVSQIKFHPRVFTNSCCRLHKEIWDFYYHVRPRDFEQFIRTKLVEDLRNKVRDFYGDADILTFGSFPAGLYLPTADMDLVLVSDQFMRGGRAKYGQSRNDIFKFANFLRQQDIPIKGSVDCITKARVPLVKYVDNVTGLKVDISFENDTGLIAIRTFRDWKTEFPAMPILVTLIKHLLSMRGLNEPVNGGIGGFSVTCLVVSLLQNMPQVQSGNMIPEHHLGEILMEFLKLYGKEFNTTTTAISFKPPGYISKVRLITQLSQRLSLTKFQAHLNITYKAPSEKFSIIDPNNPENDIAGGSSNTRIIRECFYDAYERLQERIGSLQQSASAHRRNQSILGCILAGNYSSFDRQRQHLAHVHEKLFGPVTDD